MHENIAAWLWGMKTLEQTRYGCVIRLLEWRSHEPVSGKVLDFPFQL